MSQYDLLLFLKKNKGKFFTRNTLAKKLGITIHSIDSNLSGLGRKNLKRKEIVIKYGKRVFYGIR